jgi:hypothetical protein
VFRALRRWKRLVEIANPDWPRLAWNMPSLPPVLLHGESAGASSQLLEQFTIEDLELEVGDDWKRTARLERGP